MIQKTLLESARFDIDQSWLEVSFLTKQEVGNDEWVEFCGAIVFQSFGQEVEFTFPLPSPRGIQWLIGALERVRRRMLLDKLNIADTKPHVMAR